MLGRVRLVEDPKEFVEKQKLGPDALNDLNAETFGKIMRSRRGMLKSTLMNQQVIAGIGNVYSDEILFQDRLHPKIPLKELKDSELEGLFETMSRVLKASIEAKADPDQLPAGFLIPRREKNAACPRCKNGRVKRLRYRAVPATTARNARKDQFPSKMRLKAYGPAKAGLTYTIAHKLLAPCLYSISSIRAMSMGAI